MDMMYIRMKPEVIAETDKHTGEVILQVPVRRLTKKEAAVLDSLFPNTRQGVERLLSAEAVLNAIKQ